MITPAERPNIAARRAWFAWLVKWTMDAPNEVMAPVCVCMCVCYLSFNSNVLGKLQDTKAEGVNYHQTLDPLL
jgi:hypothetical protein